MASIRQIDNPSGSAPPFEQGATTSGWIINPGRQEERRRLEIMIKHLQDDPLDNMDASVLRFVYKEWPLLAPSMNTKTTVRNVKKRLEAMEVEYIPRTPDNDWLFWQDYSIEGLLDITPPPDKHDYAHNTRDIEDTMSQSSESEGIIKQVDEGGADDAERTTKMHDITSVSDEHVNYDQDSIDDISQDNAQEQDDSSSVSTTSVLPDTTFTEEKQTLLGFTKKTYWHCLTSKKVRL